MSLQNQEILTGLRFLKIPTEQFKTNRLSLSFFMPIRHETASANAILPYILRRSCQEYPDFTALNKKLGDLYGARLYADVGKMGDVQRLTLSIAAIDDRFALRSEKVGEECAGLLCSLVLNPLQPGGQFTAEDVEAEKRQLIEQIQGELADKRSYARSRLREQMYEGDPFAVSRLGTIEQVQALTPEAVTKAFEILKEKALMQIVMVGMGEEASVKEAFRQGFKNQPRNPVKLQTAVRASADDVRRFEDVLEVNQAKLVMGFNTQTAEPEGDIFPMQLMTALFGGTPHSRLFLNVRERLSLCYYCAAVYDKNKGHLSVDSGLDLENAKLAEEEVLNQLAFVQRGEFTDEELSAARLSLQNSFSSVGDNQGALEGYYISRIFDKELLPPAEALKRVSAVTREQVVEAANKVSLDSIYLLKGGAAQ